MARKRKGAEAQVLDAANADTIPELFPTATSHEALVNEMLTTIPPEHHAKCWEVARHMCNDSHRAMALAAGALVAQEMYEPNSSYGMWPYIAANAGVRSGAVVTPGVIYQLVAYINGQLATGLGGGPAGAVQFKRGQRFFGLLTGPIDSNAGWTFAGNTVAMATDAISGIETDTSFAIFRPEVVKARLIKGEYESHEIIEIVPFTASAYLPVGITAATMVEGLSVQFWDDRCLNAELTWMLDGNLSYQDMVREIMARIEGGRVTRGLLRGYVPERNRRRAARIGA